ncbi:ATP-dependent DNA ligase [Shewanella sairae]|uniref:ATP-dependent DNA ligase n=1 Tax=Shewanella sairae TaxID=190310 RepID=A0ABQ4P6K8_9GAMM|nr:DNA ligase [Shewanella sairae]MCL1130742.1 DNA ligase [Shewanella sairae]GIU43048.1 ATP-dependent DNA ligase [Shewanella sairae]
MMIRMIQFLCISLSFSLYIANIAIADVGNMPPTKPLIQLATTASSPISNVSDYLISEKLDGVRGYWDGKNLYSRSGRIIAAPDWFVQHFPKYPLDGELWIKRGAFEQVSAIIRKTKATDTEWSRVLFMVFDLPTETTPFASRYKKAENELTGVSAYLQVIKQYSLTTTGVLDADLQAIIELGGEGLMLHKKTAFYQAGRSQDIVKLKPFYDAEAVVIAHNEGKGKFSGMLGALVVENQDGKVFKLGSGLSNEQRLNPPKVGSLVTYKYYGLTQKGTPRFASFLRVRTAQ